MADELLSTSQAAERLNVAVSTITLWCREGTLQCFKVSDRWVILASSLTDFEPPKRGRPSRLIGRTVRTNDGRTGTIVYLIEDQRAMLQLGDGTHVSYPIDKLGVSDIDTGK